MEDVVRKELRDRGQLLAQHALTLVTAPGGSGKSTLMRAWREDLEVAGGRMAWLTIGRLHRDPIAFIEDLVDSILEVLPEPLEGAEVFGTALSRALPRSGEISADPIVRLFERELRSLASPLTICLDALEHLDREGTTLAIIDRLVRGETRNIHWLLASRGLQPGAAAKMLADGSAIEINASDLSLRSDQLESVLRSAGVELDQRQLEQLLGRTEGWAIAIRFAARALSSVARQDRSRFIADLVKERDLFRYITSELVEGIGPELAHTIEIASVLGGVDRETLAAALETSDAWERIDEAIEAGLLHAAGSEISVHELLAEWMRLRLQSRLSDAEWRALHLRLGGLVEKYGRELDALGIYRSAGLVEPVADLLSRSGTAWVNRGHYDLASDALEELPESLRTSNPALMAVAGVIEGGRDPDTAIESLTRATELFREAGDRAAEFEALHELAIIAVNENRMDEIIRLFRYTLTLRRVVLEPRLRGMVVMAMGNGAYVTGRYRAALRLLKLASTFDHAPRERGGIFLCRSVIHFYRGDWDTLISEVDEVCSDERQRAHGPGFFAMQTRRCTALGLRGIDVPGCRATLEEASQMFITARHSMNRLECEAAHAQVAFRAGDFEATIALLLDAIAIAQRIKFRESEAACLGLLARAYQRSGDLDRALEAAGLALALLNRKDTWKSRFSLAPMYAPGAALAAVVYAEISDAKEALQAIESKRRRLVHRDLSLCAHAIHLCIARVAELAGDEARTRKELDAGARASRDAGLRDVAAEIDEELFDWAESRTKRKGTAGAATSAETFGSEGNREPFMRISTFGGLGVSVAGRQVTNREWRGTTARRLMIRLLVAGGQPLSRERIETDLWPDASSTAASNSLRVALSRLRDALEPGRQKGASSRVLRIEGERISLREEAIEGWDVRLWRNALETLESAAESGDVLAARAALEKVRQPASGGFLPESFDDWSLEFRRALEEQWLRIGKRATSSFTQAGESEVAVEIASALLESYRDDEAAWECLVEARLRGADRSGALRTIREARSALDSELGIELGATLLSLEAEARDRSA